MSDDKSQEIQHQIYNQEIYYLFKKIDKDNILSQHDGQSVQEFIEMEKETNETGTGRFRIEDQRKTISLLEIQSSPSSTINLERIKQLFECYFPNMTIKISQKILKLKNSKSKLEIIDENKQLQFPIKKKNKFHKESLEVFSLFDIFVEYLEKDDYSLIVFINQELYEEGLEETLVTGRACGDRVGVISTHSQYTEPEILGTAIHEYMHTMGFDHCIYWDCLMNAGYSQDQYQFLLCPIDLLKLQTELKFDVIERYKQLENQFKKLGQKSQAEIIEQLIYGINQFQKLQQQTQEISQDLNQTNLKNHKKKKL